MKRKLLFVYVFIAFVLVCNSVYATITMDMALDADKTTVNPGDELTVTVKLKNISDAISSIETGFIDVDESVVGEFSENMLVKKEAGKMEIKVGDTTSELSYAVNPTNNNANYQVIFNTKSSLEGHDCRFLMDFKQDVKGDVEILGLNLKVKDTATIKEVKDAVKVELAVVYSEAGEVTTPISKALDIKVEKAVQEEPEKPADENKVDENKVDENKADENKVKEPTQQQPAKTDENKNKNNTNTNKANTNTNSNTNNTNKTNTNVTANNTNSDGTVSASKLPAAGARMLLLPVIIAAVLGYISYTKYLKYKDI